jgi:hypothetical protein
MPLPSLVSSSNNSGLTLVLTLLPRLNVSSGVPFVSSDVSQMRASPNGQTVCELGYARVPVPDAPFVRPIFNETVPQVTMLGVGKISRHRRRLCPS